MSDVVDDLRAAGCGKDMDHEHLMFRASNEIEVLRKALNATAERLNLVMRSVGCYDEATIDAALRDYRAARRPQ